jgi:hypothetical protein
MTLLHGILRSPLPSGTVVPRPVCLQELGDVWNQRIIGIGVSEKGTDRKQNLTNRQSRTPLVLEDIETDTTVRVDVTVVDTGGEMDLRRLERIVGGKVNIQEENSSSVRGIVWAHNRCLPVEHIISDWAG